jgi:hypothetical protein
MWKTLNKSFSASEKLVIAKFPIMNTKTTMFVSSILIWKEFAQQTSSQSGPMRI